ncbi:MAG: tRNA (adenosine(37)-N6)-dimethylallyltransferase MiaA [Clostridiales bacterium]|nr:tRNA (adenosine(37)-N6)-dimethylallyltransferase MiaA [Clostridiales bacterium]
MNDKIIAVAGPTASGKSALALELCKRLDGELISLDSMQIYRGLDIGTAKPTKAEQAEVRHHMINICEPTENFSAAEFAERAHKVIADVRSRGKRAVLCGGTGLYLDTVLGRLDFGEIESDEKLRGELIAFAEKNGAKALHERLRGIDPQAAEKIHPNNVRRVARAIEIYELTGKTKTEHDREAISDSPYESLIIGLDYDDREVLYSRINRRVDAMIEAGLEREVRSLLSRGLLSAESTAGQAIGYKEMLGYIAGDCSLGDAVEKIKLGTRRYAKRQLTWLRRNPSINWLYPDRLGDFQSLVGEAEKIIGK